MQLIFLLLCKNENVKNLKKERYKNMITLKDAVKLREKEDGKHSEEFDKEYKQVDDACFKFLDAKLIDKYLDELIKKHVINGEAEYKFEDFFKQNELAEKWDKKKAELLKECPVFTKLNDPTRILKQQFYFDCEDILKHYGYVGEAIDIYNHSFTWISDSREPKSMFEKFIARRRKNEQMNYLTANIRNKFDKEQKDKEETRKMTKFAKILVKEFDHQK